MHYQWGFWQMKYVDRFLILAATTGLLSACGGGSGGFDNSAQVDPGAASRPAVSDRVSDTPVKIGAPYKIGGTTYTPADVDDYDEVGYASFYGQELAGRPTANGEIFRPSGVSGAHKTLPLPSYVEVTSLDTGKTILVRLNDRGPFANDRLIDLSEGAARQLGITQQGVAGVRVRKVNPAEQERSVLQSGGPAIERLNTPDSLLVVLRENLAKLPRPSSTPVARPVSTAAAPSAGAAPASNGRQSGRFIREGTATSPRPGAATPRQAAPAPRRQTQAQPAARPATRASGRFIREGGSSSRSAAPAARTSGFIVQLASFGSRARADALARQLGANVEASDDGSLFRVRYGPFASEAEAQRGLATAQQRGYPNARIFRR